MNSAKRLFTHPYVKRALTLGGASVAGGATFVVSFPHVEDAFWVWKDPGRVSEKSSLTLSADGVLDCPKTAVKMKGGSECPEDGSRKQRLVVLGSGWASCSILKTIDRDKYDVTVVSPRNHFAYTPLLPSVCVGTISPDAVSVPIREFTSYKTHGYLQRIKYMVRGHLPSRVDYIYAAATDINPVGKTLNCEHHAADGICKEFKVPYDMLVVGTGATTNTFNTKGVDEYCYFLKQTGDATLIRDKVLENLEVASLPGASDEERSNLLSVYVVGGGPTGVEFAAELQDFLMDDVVNPKHAIYKRCAGSTSVTVVQSNAHLLPGYQRAIQDCAEKNLQKIGVDILTNTRVIGISKDHISVMDKATKKKSDLPYGLVVWATGVSPIPLAKSLISKLPEQDSHRAIRTNSRCQVVGAEDSIFAVGDCADITVEKEYKDYILQFYREQMKNSGGSDGLSEEANIAFVEGLKSHLGNMFGEGVTGYKVQGQIIQEKLIADFANLLEIAKTRRSSFKGLKEADVEKIVANRLKRQTFHPPTAQVAHQQGEFLADMLNKGVYVPEVNGEKGKWSFDHVDPFSFNNMGQMVYLGGHIAAMTIPASEEVSVDWNGTLTNTVWHGAYWGMLDSMSARCALLFDWTRGRLFGRPTSLNAICTPNSSSGEAVNMSRPTRD